MRPDRLSATRNPVKDYLRALNRDSTRSAEDQAYLEVQARALLREFEGASAGEMNRLRAALECLETGRDRSQPWAVRGPALDRASRILQGLGAIPRRSKGKTIAAKRRGWGGGLPSAREARPEDAAYGANDADDDAQVEDGDE